MTDRSRRKAGKRELALVGAIFFVALIFLLWNRSRFSSPAVSVEISIDGKVLYTLDLSKDQELEIESAGRGSNHLIIQNKEAWISDATCPDKICVHQGKISQDGEQIVCLPNRMIARITGE